MKRYNEKTIYFAITRDYEIIELPDLYVALAVPNLYCVFKSWSGRMKYTNTAGERDDEFHNLSIYDCAGKDGLGKSGFYWKTIHYSYKDYYSSTFNNLSIEISDPDRKSLRKDFAATSDVLLECVKYFRGLTDTREELRSDINRLIVENKLLREELKESKIHQAT